MRAISTPQEREEAKAQQERIEADDYFKQYNWTPSGATYSDIENWLRAKGVTSNRKISNMFDTAKESGIIYKSGRKYYYAGLNKEVPNDQSETLPFARQEDYDED
jgi:hypothetical protein